MSDTVTHDIRIQVESEYIPHQSDPRRGYYFFIYHVTIHNQGQQVVQLKSRHWIITDGHGHVHEVKGPGVVGHQPILRPGEMFRYSSSCPLPTQVGSMQGSFQFVTREGERFDGMISPFTLADPLAFN